MPNPGIVKGGFIHFGSNALMGPVVAFQFNPETLERTALPVDSVNQRKEVIRFTLEFDATDALERGDPTTAEFGIHPALAALEMLLQTSANAAGNVSNAAPGGTVRAKPFTLFVWGSQRVIPIKFTQLEIHETMFDVQLNPLRATVNVLLEVLSDADLETNPNAQTFMDSHLRKKEWLAGQPGSSGSTEALMAAARLNKPSG
ncbi:MAG: hypothetical protein NTZ35_10535 [Ignavibacteriales bacterium]|nr:hypothetical protein [Ignavibacteriales bacterium]